MSNRFYPEHPAWIEPEELERAILFGALDFFDNLFKAEEVNEYELADVLADAADDFCAEGREGTEYVDQMQLTTALLDAAEEFVGELPDWTIDDVVPANLIRRHIRDAIERAMAGEVDLGFRDDIEANLLGGAPATSTFPDS